VPNVLTDTDVFVDHLRGARRYTPINDRVWYSVVTRCELFAGRSTDETLVAGLLDRFVEVPIDRDIAERAGRLRRFHGVPIADALIAGTALALDLVLVTRNLRHFQRVPSLKVKTPES
jgi:predicted nucleic acid-binding protein